MAVVSGKYLSPLSRLIPTILLAASFAVGTAAREGKTQWLPRKEMVSAIIGFAESHCGQVDGLLAELIETHCKDPTAGFAFHMGALMALGTQSDEALRDLCRKHKISECQTQEEVSRGQPLFVLDSMVATTGSPLKATWSPDNRFLLFDYNRGKTGLRVLNLASGQLLEKSLAKSLALAPAWSQDGRYIAVAFSETAFEGQKPPFGGIRILSVASWEEVGVIPATKDGCRFQGVNFLAFIVDSRSIWVTCQENDFRSAARIAIKLGLPDLACRRVTAGTAAHVIVSEVGPNWEP